MNDVRPVPTDAPDSDAVESSKRAYRKPVITEYGSVLELTRGSGTSGSDFMAPTRFK